MFKVATCTVSGYDEREATLQRRMVLLSDAVPILSNKGVDLFCLPGGYLYVSNEDQIHQLKTQIQQLAKNANIDLLVGIDIGVKNIFQTDDLVQRRQLPSLSLFASWNCQVSIWRQRTTSCTNQYFVSDDVCQEERLLRATPRVEGVLCGEIFNQRIRDGLGMRNTVLVIDQAHISKGFRVFGPMKSLSQNGISSLCSVHTDRREGVKYCYVPDERDNVRKSSRIIDIEVGNFPRIEIKIWKFDLSGRLIEA
jgi:hypothetical protein